MRPNSTNYREYPPWQALQAAVTELGRHAGVRLFVEMDIKIDPFKAGQNTYRLYNEGREKLCRGVPNLILGFAEGFIWRSFNPHPRLRLKKQGFLSAVLDSNNTLLCKWTTSRAVGFMRGSEFAQKKK